jgi:hypothetical protein
MQCRGAFSAKNHTLEVHYYTTFFQNRSLRIRPIKIGQEKTTRRSEYHVTTSVIKIESSRSLARSLTHWLLLLLHHPTRLATAEYPILRREGKKTKKQKIQQRSSKKKKKNTAATAGASADLLFKGGGGRGMGVRRKRRISQ